VEDKQLLRGAPTRQVTPLLMLLPARRLLDGTLEVDVKLPHCCTHELQGAFARQRESEVCKGPSVERACTDALLANRT
jgi:hypothetical protein